MKNEIKEIEKELNNWIREEVSYEEQEHYLQWVKLLKLLDNLLKH